MDAFNRNRALKLRHSGQAVIVVEARENLGYAGAINASITALGESPSWEGYWVLNPDTEPEPGALRALVDYAAESRKGLVGSRLMHVDRSHLVRTRGLRWRKFMAAPIGVDNYAPVLPRPDSAEVEARIDAPSGASFYITRECLARIGLMDERYFLYYEDLDWGVRAKATCGIGYAYDSVVPHVGGRSIGSAPARAARSRLSVYLESRNRFLFVRRHYRGWIIWTLLMSLLRAGEFLAAGSPTNFWTALLGIRAGLRGETGRPDHMIIDHRPLAVG